MGKSRSKASIEGRKPARGILPSISWSHPLTILVLSTIIGLAGWAGRALWLERGDINARTDDIRSPATLPDSVRRNDTASDTGYHNPESGAAGTSGPTTSPTSAQPTTASPAGTPPAANNALVKTAAEPSGVNAGLALVTTRDTRQEVALATQTFPHIGSERLFCDTLQTTLVINYAYFGNHPVAITRVAFHFEPAGLVQTNPCIVDPLSAQPKGITLRDSYIFTIRSSSISAKYIVSGNVGEASDVSVQNILETKSGIQTIILQPTDQPVVREIYVNSVAPIPMKVWFTVYYDLEGAKSVDTHPIYIARSQ